MAVVYLAHDHKLGRKVALKVLRPELAASLGSDRFVREIEIAAKLTHPNILGLHDCGGGAECLFYAMPFVEGESLRDRLNRETLLPIEDALQITKEVAEALGHAHSLGIVHRDIKPENILLHGGHALVADFGIAKAVTEAGDDKLTETGIAIGTPAYMSPEQASGTSALDARSDIYSLACVLYEMLAGEPPHTGPSMQAIIAKKMSEPTPRISVVRETVPRTIETALVKALAKNPVDRYATAQQFVADLLAVERGGRARRSLKLRGISRQWTIAGGVALIGLLCGIVWWAWPNPTVAPSENRIAVLPLMPALSGDTALAGMGRVISARITGNLRGLGNLEVVDYAVTQQVAGQSLSESARGLRREYGAGRVLRGTVQQVGTDVTIDAVLLSTAGLDTESFRFTGPAGDPHALADSVTWQLVDRIWVDPTAPSDYHEILIGRPFPAVREFLDAERHFREGRLQEAADAYLRAFRADSTLWVASRLYGYLTAGGFQLERLDSAAAVAYQRAPIDQMPPVFREFELFESLPTREERLTRGAELRRRHPDFGPLAEEYADDLYHWGRAYGHSMIEAIDQLEASRQVMRGEAHLLDHLLYAATGRDSAARRRAFDETEARDLWYSDSVRRFQRLLSQALDGNPSSALTDTVAAETAFLMADSVWGQAWPLASNDGGVLAAGLPGLFIELAQRIFADGTHPDALYWMAAGWMQRGAWDSAAVYLDRFVRESTSHVAPVSAYRAAVMGEWSGGLPAGSADQYRSGATEYLLGLDTWGARQLWSLDGVLAFARRDLDAVHAARTNLRQLRHFGADRAANILWAFERVLSDDEGEAASMLYGNAMDSIPRPGTLSHFLKGSTFLHVVSRISGGRLLLAKGDTARARRMLLSAEAPLSEQDEMASIFAPLALLELARIADARGRDARARYYYHQFLRNYDMPVAVHRPWVTEARAAMVRLGDQ